MIYSPSSTRLWLRCPVMYQLSRVDGWQTRRLGKRDIAAIAGGAWAQGMEQYHRAKMFNSDPDIVAVWQTMDEYVTAEEGKIAALGREVPSWEQTYYCSIRPRLQYALKSYPGADPLSGMTIISTEHAFTLYGNARPDLIVRTGDGRYAIVDQKFKLRLEAKNWQREVDRYKNDWAMLHYTWAARNVFDIAINTYYICIVVADPRFSATLIEYPVHPETMQAWEVSARAVWDRMFAEEQDITPRWMAASHEDQYGPCEYQRACFDFHWDEGLMGTEYVQEVRHVPETGQGVAG